jgi:hypothetical protein
MSMRLAVRQCSIKQNNDARPRCPAPMNDNAFEEVIPIDCLLNKRAAFIRRFWYFFTPLAIFWNLAAVVIVLYCGELENLLVLVLILNSLVLLVSLMFAAPDLFFNPSLHFPRALKLQDQRVWLSTPKFNRDFSVTELSWRVASPQFELTGAFLPASKVIIVFSGRFAVACGLNDRGFQTWRRALEENGVRRATVFWPNR